MKFMKNKRKKKNLKKFKKKLKIKHEKNRKLD